MARKRRKRTHGTGSLLPRGNRWVAQWTDASGKRCTRSAPTEDLARAQLTQALAGQVAPERKRGTLEEHAQEWLATRAEMSSNYEDRNRWQNHWGPAIGAMSPADVDILVLKRCFREFRAKGLSKTTVKLLISLLSSLYGDLVEEGVVPINPTRMLSKKTRRNELRPEHDPKKVPFIREPADVPRIYAQLFAKNPSVAVAYAIGATCGLRTGEVRALDWAHVDLERRVIHVQDQPERRRGKPAAMLSETGVSTPKDDDSRFVPIPDSLYPILLQQRERTGGVGLVCPPLHAGAPQASRSTRVRFLGEHVLGRLLRQALPELQLPRMIWYQATRHSFASQWVLRGGTLERLQEILGHSSVSVTERYAHLTPGRFSDADRNRVPMDFGSVIHSA